MRVMQAAIAVSMMTVLVCGCALVGGPTPADEILVTLAEYHTAEKAGDVEQMLVVISDDFSNSQGATKPMLRGFLNALAAQGVLQTVSVDLAKCEITVDGDSAILEPIVYTSSMGLASYSYKMRKEADGVWRLINSEQI
jgi:hypothetical protein